MWASKVIRSTIAAQSLGSVKVRAHSENAEFDATATEAQVGFVTTGVAGDFAASAPANALIDMVYALGAGYRANATWIMNSRLAGMVRRMRDGDGRYLWSDGLAAGEPARLLGYPVLISEDMPNPAAGAKTARRQDRRGP